MTMTIKRVGIIGSGTMGSGIAEVACKNGYEVVLRSRSREGADRMVAGLEKSLTKQVDKGRLTEPDRDAALTLVALIDGTTALYFSTGGEIVAEKKHESVCSANESFIGVANSPENCSHSTDQFARAKWLDKIVISA